MKDSLNTPAREYAPGQGDAVADRTINRKKPDGSIETWADVSRRVALGNASLSPIAAACQGEFEAMHHHLRQASLLMSGRHLQHGDETQPTRNQEVFTNCLEFSTRILTMEHGPIEIGKIAGEVVTVIAGDGKPRRAMINEHGEQDLFELEFVPVLGGGTKLRKTVTATANHRWKLRDGSMTSAIKEGDVIAPINGDVGMDPAAVVHGLVFGDGTAHKSRVDAARHFSQGRTYASLRVCKQDSAKDEIHKWLDAAGYSFTTPASAHGDRVYYIGKFEGAKEVPFCRDQEYIAGFIYGWWLADGHKGIDHALEISTSNESHAAWLEENCAYAGFAMTTHRVMERKEGDGSFANGKALHVMRLRKGVEWRVKSIAPAGRDTVFCPEEPVTGTFVLANGLLTGNCSTAASSFILFYLLLNGSGVGTAYDDDMMTVDWAKNLPHVVPVIRGNHPDVLSGEIGQQYVDVQFPQHEQVVVFEVPDSREGWAKATEKIEFMTWQGTHANTLLLLDFSGVRHRGQPIGGMQNRPASGPGPLMHAIAQIAALKGSGKDPWEATMHVDHYLSECVLVGGARRAARMATKTWRDKSVLRFVSVKKGGVLWSSNNSVTVDQEFWDAVKKVRFLKSQGWGVGEAVQEHVITDLERHAHDVFEAVCQASYFDGTGEPGLINVDKLVQINEGVEALFGGEYAESERFKLDPETKQMTAQKAKVFSTKGYTQITNPCGEISLALLGGYCVIADVVPFFAGTVAESTEAWDADAEDAFRTATRALIRVNTMDCLYKKEVLRTNRIGVGITGLHEYAWSRFGYGWKDIVNEAKSLDFWLMLSRFSNACVEEADRYAQALGMSRPHTVTTMKPAGTTSKLFGLTEGAHLPSMREYLRWVQFRNDDPLIEEYRAKGYPVRKLVSYSGTTIVGFPTVPMICSLGMGDKLVTAAEATPEEQYQFLRLMEKYWIDGFDPQRGHGHGRGNQVSYTLKYNPQVVDFEAFTNTLLDGQSSIRCCSVMPQADTSAYEYQPEEPVSRERFEELVAAIDNAGVKEDIGREHVDCGGGACPIDFSSQKVA